MKFILALRHPTHQVKYKDTLSIMLGFCNNKIRPYVGDLHVICFPVDHLYVEEFPGRDWFTICGKGREYIGRSCCDFHSRCGDLDGGSHSEMEKFPGRYCFRIHSRGGGCNRRRRCGYHSGCGGLNGGDHDGDDANMTK